MPGPKHRHFQLAQNRSTRTQFCLLKKLPNFDCCKYVQCVTEENPGVEGACEASSQADRSNADQARESGGHRSIVRLSKQNKISFEDQHKNSDL